MDIESIGIILSRQRTTKALIVRKMHKQVFSRPDSDMPGSLVEAASCSINYVAKLRGFAYVVNIPFQMGLEPGAVARSDARPPGMRTVAGPHVRQHSFVVTGHEIISMAILCLPLIQEGQLSVTGERMCTKCW